MALSSRKFSVDSSQSTVRSKTKNESKTQTEIGTKAETGLVFLRLRIEIPPISIRNRDRQSHDKSNPKEPGTTLKTENWKLSQRLDADLFEKHNIVVAVILQADVALVGANTMLRLEIELAFGDGLAFGVVGDGDIVENNGGVRTVKGDDHGVPLGPGLAGFGEGLGQRIKRAGNVIFVFVGSFGMVVNLDFVAVVNGHPFLARFEGDANEDSGIVVEVAHFVDDANAAIGKLAPGPVEQAHAAVGSNKAVFDRHATGADMFPAGEILAVEERLPCRSLRRRGGDSEES